MLEEKIERALKEADLNNSNAICEPESYLWIEKALQISNSR